MIYQLQQQVKELSLSSLKRTFDYSPDFEAYNLTHLWTQSIKKMWHEESKCGGPITKDLNSDSEIGIKTPDYETIINKNKEKVLGFYNINKIRRNSAFSTAFFDIELLLVAPKEWKDEDKQEAKEKLSFLQKNNQVKCCMSKEGL